MKAVLFTVNGGLGRNIAATAVVRNIKKQYPDHKLFVAASSPTLFLGNPLVDKVFRFGVDNLYEEIIIGNEKDVVVLDVEPYRDIEYLRKNEHMTKAWCRLCGVPCDSIVPDIRLYKTEMRRGKAFVSRFEKPVLVFQPFGGPNPEHPTDGAYYESRLMMHRRDLDLDVARRLAAELKKSFQILHVKTPNQPQIPETIPITADIRDIMAIMTASSAILTIDSFSQHAAPALGKSAVVAWSGTSPACQGYDTNTNITISACENPECHRPNTFFGDVMADGRLWNCPFDEACTQHDADGLVDAVMRTLPKKVESGIKKKTFAVVPNPNLVKKSKK